MSSGGDMLHLSSISAAWHVIFQVLRIDNDFITSAYGQWYCPRWGFKAEYF